MQAGNLLDMTLYEIVNNITKEGYVGITHRPLFKRQREHMYDLRGNRHGNQRLQNAFNKYGESAFQLIVRATFDSLEKLNQAEKEVLEKEKDRLYNFAPGGNAFQHYLESKQKISSRQLKPVIGMSIETGELREYVSVSDTVKDGFNHQSIGGACKLTKYKNSFTRLSVNDWVWMYKKDFTLDEMNRRRELAKRGKVRNERPVMGKNLKTGEIVTFKSASEAGRNGFAGNTIYRSCSGHVKAHGGFVWVYGDIEDSQSLLKQRYEIYKNNPPKTGPKMKKVQIKKVKGIQ